MRDVETVKEGKKICGCGDSNRQDVADSERYFPSLRETLCSHSFLCKGKELSPGFRRNEDSKSGFN